MPIDAERMYAVAHWQRTAPTHGDSTRANLPAALDQAQVLLPTENEAARRFLSPIHGSVRVLDQFIAAVAVAGINGYADARPDYQFNLARG